MGKGGEQATWKGAGVGRLLKGGAVTYRGALYYYSDSPNFRRLNAVAVIFEYSADADGNTKNKLWEWK